MLLSYTTHASPLVALCDWRKKKDVFTRQALEAGVYKNILTYNTHTTTTTNTHKNNTQTHTCCLSLSFSLSHTHTLTQTHTNTIKCLRPQII